MEPDPDDGLTAQLLALELALAGRDHTAVPGGLATLLDDGFVEIGQSGRRWDRAATIAALRDAPPADVVIDGFTVERLAPDVALATYRIRPTDGSAGQASERSSTWVRRDGHWRLRFHQGTPSA